MCENDLAAVCCCLSSTWRPELVRSGLAEVSAKLFLPALQVGVCEEARDLRSSVETKVVSGSGKGEGRIPTDS